MVLGPSPAMPRQLQTGRRAGPSGVHTRRMCERIERVLIVVSCWMTPVFTATAAAMTLPGLWLGWVLQFPIPCNSLW